MGHEQERERERWSLETYLDDVVVDVGAEPETRVGREVGVVRGEGGGERGEERGSLIQQFSR